MMPESASAPVYLAEPERPFWGFGEIFVLIGIFIVGAFLGGIGLRAAGAYFHFDPTLGLPLLVLQFILYIVLFIALKVLFTVYDQPLFRSLAWIEQPFRPLHLVVLGVVLAAVVVVLGNLLRTPNVQTPFDQLLTNLPSRIAIAIFGITVGPFVEELLFRGFLQPVLVSTLGVFPGILVTSIVFGCMHLVQNADIWQTGVLITIVGFVLGVVRHLSGSTRASTIVHISYNALPFLTLFISGGAPGTK